MLFSPLCQCCHQLSWVGFSELLSPRFYCLWPWNYFRRLSGILPYHIALLIIYGFLPLFSLNIISFLSTFYLAEILRNEEMERLEKYLEMWKIDPEVSVFIWGRPSQKRELKQNEERKTSKKYRQKVSQTWREKYVFKRAHLIPDGVNDRPPPHKDSPVKFHNSKPGERILKVMRKI